MQNLLFVWNLKEREKNATKHQQQCDNYGKLVNHAKYRKKTLISTACVLFFRYHMWASDLHLLLSGRYQL